MPAYLTPSRWRPRGDIHNHKQASAQSLALILNTALSYIRVGCVGARVCTRVGWQTCHTLSAISRSSSRFVADGTMGMPRPTRCSSRGW